MRSKYGARKVRTPDGLTFDSKKEYRRWVSLVALEKAGEIANLQRQVKFVLIPAQREPDTIGKRGGVRRGKIIEREVAYIADFVYQCNGETVVEDAKGLRLPEYVLKRKMMLHFHGIRINEV